MQCNGSVFLMINKITLMNIIVQKVFSYTQLIQNWMQSADKCNLQGDASLINIPFIEQKG